MKIKILITLFPPWLALARSVHNAIHFRAGQPRV